MAGVVRRGPPSWGKSTLAAPVIGPRAQIEPYEGWDDRYVAGLPPKVQRALLRERKLEEATGSDRARAAINYILGLNWKPSPRPCIDLEEARRILDDSHAGLVVIKEAVLDWLATHTPAAPAVSPFRRLHSCPRPGVTIIARSAPAVEGRRPRPLPVLPARADRG